MWHNESVNAVKDSLSQKFSLQSNEIRSLSSLQARTQQFSRDQYQLEINSSHRIGELVPLSYSLADITTSSKPITQRKLNTSSRKRIDHLVEMQIDYQRSPIKYTNAHYIPPSFNPIQGKNSVNNQKQSNNLSSDNLQQKELQSKPRQAQPQKRSIYPQQLKEKQEIKTFKSMTRVPYYQKYIQYEPELIMIPREKVIGRNYAVENIIDYVPVVEEHVEGYDLVPREVINHKLQYQLVEKKIVHLPRDEAWMGVSVEKRKIENVRSKRKDPLKSPQNVYQNRRLSDKSDKSVERRQYSANKNNFLNHGKGSINHLGIQSRNIYTGELRQNNNDFELNLNTPIIYPHATKQTHQAQFLSQQFQSSTSPTNKIDTYDNLVDFYCNYEPNTNLNANSSEKRFKPTFHVTSEGRKRLE